MTRSTPHYSSFAFRQSSFQPAFTVLELLTVLAFLVVMMGLMVSLARYVRSNSAVELTRRVLGELAVAQMNYTNIDTNKNTNIVTNTNTNIDTNTSSDTTPDTHALPAKLDETAVQQYLVRISNTRVRQLLERASLIPPDPVIRDAWGNAILLVPRQHDQLGMAPRNDPFFISAGPDGKYLTLDDNLYSYEQSRPDSTPITRPTGGQRE